MPLTIAHPAAVIPLRLLRLQFLSWPALVIGTMCPDFDYFLTLSNRSGAGHTFMGTLTFCLPLGLFLYVLLQTVIKRPVALLLPRDDQERLWSDATAGGRLTARSLFIASVSVTVGAWTHLVWDSLTHSRGWGPQNIPVLGLKLFDVAGYEVAVFKILQHGSTVVGLAALCWLFLVWRRSTPKFPGSVPLLKPWSRAVLCVVLVAGPAVSSAIFASAMTPEIHSFMDFRLWLGAFAVSVHSFFGIALLLVSAVLLIWEHQLTRSCT